MKITDFGENDKNFFQAKMPTVWLLCLKNYIFMKITEK